MEYKRLALLIDSENISARYMSIISEELTKYGVITYKRVYGDWNNSQTAKWREKVSEYALTPVQQFRNTAGKNAIDSALIIDAMDILYTNKVEGFCIVSSDSDFTRLANRLRESGMIVIGMGEEKSINSFRVACSVFVNLQNIEEQKKTENLLSMEALSQTEEEIAIGRVAKIETVGISDVSRGNKTTVEQVKQCKETYQIVNKRMIEQAILAIIMKNEDKGKVTELGEVGSRLTEQYPKFSVKQYGQSSLSKLLEGMSSIQMIKINSKVMLKLKGQDEDSDKIYNYIRQVLDQNKTNGIELGTLGRYIHNKYQHFNVKDFGYSKLSSFIKSMDGIEVREECNKKNSRQIIYLKR